MQVQWYLSPCRNICHDGVLISVEETREFIKDEKKTQPLEFDKGSILVQLSFWDIKAERLSCLKKHKPEISIIVFNDAFAMQRFLLLQIVLIGCAKLNLRHL
jgi:hypothetical protein